MKRDLILGIVLSSSFFSSAYAATVNVEYTATLGFDPDGVIGVGGEATSAFIEALFGPGIGSTGSAEVTGRFTFDTDTPAYNSNALAAGYFDAIKSAEVSLGAQTATADLAEINANDPTSEFGYNSNNYAGFCADRAGCASIGQPFQPDGNRIQVINDSDFFILDESGDREWFYGRDAVFLGLGATASDNEFSPTINIPVFGDVFVDSAVLGAISDIEASVLDSVGLPGDDSFLFNDGVETAFLRITFDGPGLLEDLVLEGEAILTTEIVDDPISAVPTPASLPLLLGALGIVALRRKRA